MHSLVHAPAGTTSECLKQCGLSLGIIDLRPFDSGCMLVQWSDTSSCSAANINNNTYVSYTLEILQNCSYQNPLDTVQLSNGANITEGIVAFDTSIHNDIRTLNLQIKAESEVCRWKSRCFTAHSDIQVNTTCMANNSYIGEKESA